MVHYVTSVNFEVNPGETRHGRVFGQLDESLVNEVKAGQVNDIVKKMAFSQTTVTEVRTNRPGPIPITHTQSARPSTTNVPHPAPVYVKSSVNAMPYHLDNLAQQISQEYTPQDLAMNDHANLDQFIETDDNGNRILRLQFDMHLFRPEEVSVKTDDQMLTISAVQVDSKDGKNAHVTTNEYLRCYRLPDGINHDYFNSHLSKEGILYVDAIIGQPIQNQNLTQTTVVETTEQQQTYPDGVTRLQKTESVMQDTPHPQIQNPHNLLDNYGASHVQIQKSQNLLDNYGAAKNRGSFIASKNPGSVVAFESSPVGYDGLGAKRSMTGQSSLSRFDAYNQSNVGPSSVIGFDAYNKRSGTGTGSVVGNVGCDGGYYGKRLGNNMVVGYEGQNYGGPLGVRYGYGAPATPGMGPGGCAQGCRMPHRGPSNHQGMMEIPVQHY